MVYNKSSTALSTSKFLLIRYSVLEAIKSYYISTNSSKVNGLEFYGKLTKTTLETALRLFSTRFSIISLTVMIIYSSLSRPQWTL
jgi:hypothetical protein